MSEKEKISWIKTDDKISIFIDDEIFCIDENYKYYDVLLNSLKHDRLDFVKAILQPLKSGLIYTDNGLGIIMEYKENPLKIKILINGKIKIINSLRPQI